VLPSLEKLLGSSWTKLDENIMENTAGRKC